jgi:multimeric flavodoxin WrbA
MKKALIINGSPHKNGATAKILAMVDKMLTGTYKTEYVEAYSLRVRPCTGCFKCRPDKGCVLPEDDGQRVGKKITESDLLVVGSPTYWGNITAPLKSLFDRNVLTFEDFSDGMPKPKMTGRPALIVVTSGSGADQFKKISQSYGAVQAVKTVLQSAGYRIAGVVNMYSSWDFDTYKSKIEARINKIFKKRKELLL